MVHLHTVADWFDVPHWLETLPRKMGVVISVHDMWHVTGGCFLYRGCDRYANQTHALRSVSDLEMACKPIPGKRLRIRESCGHIGIVERAWSQTASGWPKSPGEVQ